MALTRVKPARRAAVIYGASLLGLLACGPPPDEPQRDGGTSRTDGSAEQCERNSECEDSLFCTTWRCVPGAAGADARGCIEVGPPCALGEACVEELSRCVADTCGAVTDADGDGHDSVACGGDDCDDDDPNRYPGNPERCDEEGHDEDCNPLTIAGDDGDADGDGEIDRACCNGATCGTDCDDDDRAVHPGARELCNARDDDCDGAVDEPDEGALCPGGSCVGGRCNLPAWDRVLGGPDGDVVFNVAMDERGYVYVAGTFASGARFGSAGPPEVALGLADGFVAAYEPDGAYAWFRALGADDYDVAFAIAYSPFADTVYVSARIGSEFDFGGGTRSTGTYVVAFDRSGTYLWDREFPVVQDIEAAPDGILVAGLFNTEFDFGGGGRTVSAPSTFVARYTLDGTHAWDHVVTSDGYARVADLHYRDGIIGIAGKYSGPTRFGGDLERTGAANGDSYALTLRDGTTPTIQSLFVSTGTADDEPYAIVVDADRIYLCGHYSPLGVVDFGAGAAPSEGMGFRAFLVELDAAGTHLAERTWGDPAGASSRCATLARDSSGNILVVGNFSGTVDFGGGSRSSGGLFYARYGERLSHRSDGVIPGGEVRSAEIGPADSTVIVGSMSGTVDFGSGPRTSAGGVDGFIVRFAR